MMLFAVDTLENAAVLVMVVVVSVTAETELLKIS
jgi:hypothetical protein